MEDNRNNNEEEYITINLDGSDVTDESTRRAQGRRTAKRAGARKSTRIGNDKKGKIKWSKKKIGITIAVIIAVIIVITGIAFGRYVYKAEGDVKKAVLNMASDVAVNIVGKDEPIFVLVLGISEDIFWNMDISFVFSVAANKAAYDSWVSYENRKLNERS